MNMNPYAKQYPHALEEGAYKAGYKLDVFERILERAVWEGDMDLLWEIADCRCCCDEHTFEWCPARAWGGCRGQYTPTHDEMESWISHYERFHGMTREQFFG